MNVVRREIEIALKNHRGRLLCCYGLSTSIRLFTTVGYGVRRVSISSGLDSV